MRKGVLLIAVTGALLGLMTGSAGAVIYSPSSLTFANQNAGTTSAPQEVRVGGGYCGPDYMVGMTIYPGPCYPEPSDIAVSGDFVITGNTCPASLNSPLTTSTFSCSVFVAFAPSGPGPKQGFLRVSSSPSIVGAPLSGTGCANIKTPKGKTKLICSAPVKKKKHKHHH